MDMAESNSPAHFRAGVIPLGPLFEPPFFGVLSEVDRKKGIQAMTETGTKQGVPWKDFGFQETFLAYYRDEKADALRLLATMLHSYILESRESGPDKKMRGPYRHWCAIGRDLWRLQTALLGI